MNRPTSTRAELRKLICGELNMRFFKRYDGNSTLTGGDNSEPLDSNLTQDNDYWNGAWFYIETGTGVAGQSRLITDFGEGLITLEYPLSAAIATSDNNTYEILDIFSPLEIHRAIDRAVEEAFPAFYDVNTDESMIVREDVTTYDMTAMNPRPWMVLNVSVEDNKTAVQGVVTSATNTTLIDTAGDFSSDIDSDFYVSIYDGKGVGQLRSIVTRDDSTQLTVATWTTNPDTTSKYTLWDSKEEEHNWYGLSNISFDQKQYPAKMYLPNTMSALLGQRFRVQSISAPTSMTTDSDETVVPKDYLVHKALAYLAGAKLNDNRADRQKWADLEERHSARAEMLRRTKKWQPPDITRWGDNGSNVISNIDDPLDWRT